MTKPFPTHNRPLIASESKTSGDPIIISVLFSVRLSAPLCFYYLSLLVFFSPSHVFLSIPLSVIVSSLSLCCHSSSSKLHLLISCGSTVYPSSFLFILLLINLIAGTACISHTFDRECKNCSYQPLKEENSPLLCPPDGNINC